MFDGGNFLGGTINFMPLFHGKKHYIDVLELIKSP